MKEQPQQQVGPSALEDAASSVVGVYKAVRKHILLVASFLLLAAGSGLLYTRTATRIYEAATLVEIMPRAPEPLTDKTTGAGTLGLGAGTMWGDERDYYETQYKIIASARVLTMAARNLGLQNDPEYFGSPPPARPPTLEDAASRLRGQVFVEPVKYSRLVWIKADDPDPRRAARICDAVANAYIEQNLSTAVNSTSDAVVWLSGQVDHVKNDLEQDENALHAFKQGNDLPSTSINEASNMLRLEMQEFDTALAHTRTKKEELAARHAELAKVSSDNADQLPASELLASAFLQSLRSQYQGSVAEKQALLAEGKGENHPLVRRADEKVNETKAALLAEVRNIQGAVERDLAVVEREENGESALFEGARRKAVDLNMKEIEYHRLDRTRDENEKLYAMLLERLKEADLARMMRVNNIRVVDAAAEPRAPIRPRLSIAISLSLFLGLVAGVLAAWLREQLDASLKTPDDVERKLAVSFLGLLPDLSSDTPVYGKRRRGRAARAIHDEGPVELLVHRRPLSGIAEAARTVRTNLMFMNPDRPYRTLLVTSAGPSEGKTTVACSIAIAFAQSGQRVCIVDCDLRRPRLHRLFGRSGDAGVTNVLLGEATLDEIAKPTEIENLWSAPAGPTPPNPADTLHSERFRAIIAGLEERFDRVVIDSPPVVAVTDSAVISTLVDGVVFVVRAFKTSKHLCAQGLRVLRGVDAPIVGAVLNAVNLRRQEYSYYYHYYYYKKDGYLPTGQDEQPAPTAAPH
jgi:capsular exopolysaccharide synthesis family protein